MSNRRKFKCGVTQFTLSDELPFPLAIPSSRYVYSGYLPGWWERHYSAYGHLAYHHGRERENVISVSRPTFLALHICVITNTPKRAVSVRLFLRGVCLA